MRKLVCSFWIASLWIITTCTLVALDADDLEQLLGYTMTAHSHVKGDFEGADFGKVVALDNGMIFEFTNYSYTYAYRPAVAVFARKITPEQMLKLGLKKIPDKPVTLYKLVIEDEIYDAIRLR